MKRKFSDLGLRFEKPSEIKEIKRSGNLTNNGIEIRILAQTPVSQYSAGYFDFVYNFPKYSFYNGKYNIRTKYIKSNLKEKEDYSKYDKGWDNAFEEKQECLKLSSNSRSNSGLKRPNYKNYYIKKIKEITKLPLNKFKIYFEDDSFIIFNNGTTLRNFVFNYNKLNNTKLSTKKLRIE